MDIRDFLTEIEKSGGNLLSEGKENEQVPAAYRNALERDKGLKKGDYEWLYKPDDYELVVAELKGNNQWAVYFFTEAEVSDEEGEEDLFGESLRLLDEADDGQADEQLAVLDEMKDGFLPTVKTCMEIAKNQKFKNAEFTKQMVQNVKK